MEEKLSVIRILEDRVHKHLEQKLSVIESLHERNVISMIDPEASGIFIWTIRSFENKLREAKTTGIGTLKVFRFTRIATN